MSAGRVVVRINPLSDGDATHTPSIISHTLVDPPRLYLEKLALKWMEHREEAVRGITYVLDKLPAGYSVWKKARSKNASRTRYDMWLFGHPSHKYFDSPNRYFPHFLHLMQNDGSNIGCECTVCQAKGRGRIPNIGTSNGSNRPHPQPTAPAAPAAGSSGATKQKGRPRAFDVSKPNHKDDEGTPDVYRNLIDELKCKGELDVTIEEKMSMDWRTERPFIKKWLQSLAQQPAWLPRNGEIVLVVRSLGDYEDIRFDQSTQQFVICNSDVQELTRPLLWEAGIVSQVPTEPLELCELVQKAAEGRSQVNYSGFRVELLPDPNANETRFPRYKYVALRQIRPFTFWKEFLHGMPEEERSPTISHALKAMSTFSLVEKYRFKGTWPTASIFCQAIYVGPELITVGDVIRIIPQDEEAKTATDTMRVRSIQLKFMGLDRASDDDNDDGHPYNSAVRIAGTAFTLTPRHGKSRALPTSSSLSSSTFPSSILSYGTWTLAHPPHQQLQLAFHRVLGRCYEPEAMRLWFPSGQFPWQQPLNRGLQGVRQGRVLASALDARIRDGRRWYWGDSRAEALGLASLNGVEVSAHDPDRAPAQWRKYIKLIDGVADEEERSAATRRANPMRPVYGIPAARPPLGMGAPFVKGASGSKERSASRKRSYSMVDLTQDDDENEDKEDEEDEEGSSLAGRP